MMKSIRRHLWFLGLCVLMVFPLQGQTGEKAALEARRARLQKEIQQINSLLSKEIKERKTVLEQVEDIDRKIQIRRELIRVTNQEANLINRRLNQNLKQIEKLRTDLTRLKEDYARMIRKSYQSRSRQSRLMFILSSENFLQAYKRLQYMKQYTAYRKEQGQKIEQTTTELQERNKTLISQRKEKEALAQANREEQRRFEREKDMQEDLLASIRKNEGQYKTQIQRKQREARALDRQIEKLIREAIAESNKKAGNTANTSTFALTPEAKLIANNFEANKGRLIWPVEKGVKSKGYGAYPDPVYPGVKHFNNGVTIATEKGTRVRSVFNGEVSAVIAVPNGNKAIQVRHGNFITTYYNIARVYVKKGDTVTARQELGEVFTSPSTGKTELKFFLYKDTRRLNPEKWIYRM
ncbi:murein hydrolase activator EnvC family protein [Ascidiimonas aurantiaca]|uniref:murein hydrolase activator EnvC family protein n=1 Tax=Ascidiimonas aurantiaca TaxID=1685432 RepID=UPI0030EBCFCB